MSDITLRDTALGHINWDDVLMPLLSSLSETSERKYLHTYRLWESFCGSYNIPLHDMTPKNLLLFFEEQDASHTTKVNRLSHMRRLIQALYAAMPDSPALRSMYEQVKLLKIRRNSSEKLSSQHTTALSKKEVYGALDVWSDNTPIHVRNRALISLLFYTGLRRSEAAVLQWGDIDLEAGILTVRFGKGDKERTIPILGEDAIDALSKWKAVIGEREFVFCRVYKSGKLGDDHPISDQAVYNVIKQTSEEIGVEFAPHDARRTLITRMLASGTPVSHAQFVAGHSRAETTLGYAKVKDAEEAKSKIKLNY